MPQNIDSSILTGIANFGILVLAALGFKGRIDALAKSVVFKDTCKVCGSGTAEQLQLIRDQLSEYHTEQMDLIKKVYSETPKRKDD